MINFEKKKKNLICEDILLWLAGKLTLQVSSQLRLDDDDNDMSIAYINLHNKSHAMSFLLFHFLRTRCQRSIGKNSNPIYINIFISSINKIFIDKLRVIRYKFKGVKLPYNLPKINIYYNIKAKKQRGDRSQNIDFHPILTWEDCLVKVLK